MRFQRETVTVDEAIQKLLDQAELLGVEEIRLHDAFGRVLAESVFATTNLPPFDKSPLDGFAVRSVDTVSATPANPVTLRVIETIAAGDVPTLTLSEGEASRIMTGAMIPPGADAVIMFEQTVNPGVVSETVQIKKELAQGENISRSGEEVEQGTFVIPAGEIIDAGVIATLATFGYTRVKVRMKPRVGILSTGNELIDVDKPMAPGKIRNSNTPMVIAMITESGGIPVEFDKLPDNEELAKKLVQKIIEEVDILVTTGGVSVGDFDIMASIVGHPDVELLFNRVAIRPGSPTTAAKYKGKIICALSGNPGACYAGFELFVRTLIQKKLGRPITGVAKVEAILTEDYDKPCPYPRYLRGKLAIKDTVLYAVPDLNDKSGNLTTLYLTECFIIIPAGGRGKKAGERVWVIPTRMPSWQKGE